MPAAPALPVALDAQHPFKLYADTQNGGCASRDAGAHEALTRTRSP